MTGERVVTDVSPFPSRSPYAEVQVPLIMAGVQGMLDKIPVERIVEWDAKFQEHLQANEQDLLSEISKGVMTKELEPKSESPMSPDHVVCGLLMIIRRPCPQSNPPSRSSTRASWLKIVSTRVERPMCS